MAKLIFLGGMGRSGTNLLRNILDCHSEIASGPEFNHLQDIIEVHRTLSRSIQEGRISSYVSEHRLRELSKQFISGLLTDYGDRRDKSWVVEKTPSNIWNFLEFSKFFPDAKFIQIIRDGRDVCCSHREVGKRFIAKKQTLNPRLHSSLISIFHCAALWTQTIKLGKKLTASDSPLHLSKSIMTVQYEELVSIPEMVIKEVCAFIGIPFEERMLHPEQVKHDTFVDGIWVQDTEVQSAISRKSLGSWRTSMTLEERILFAASGLEGLALAGYPAPQGWSFEGISISADEAQKIVKETQEKITTLIGMTDDSAPPSSQLQVEVSSSNPAPAAATKDERMPKVDYANQPPQYGSDEGTIFKR